MNKNNQRVLGIIPARGGSKRLPGKNVMPLQGKPLIAWTIEAGLTATCIDRLILSTDDAEISKVALEYGCEVPFARPPEFATDEASSLDVVRHALSQIPGFTHFVLLQPTSPLRRASHIDEAFQLMCAAGTSACVSMRKSTESPYWMYTIREDGYISPVASDLTSNRKQELPETYIPNGAIFISRIDKFLFEKSFYSNNTIPYLMSFQDSVDIDTLEDFKLVESLL
jgi:CMP-N,N'-diacetyllegionaminic acid synthase